MGSSVSSARWQRLFNALGIQCLRNKQLQRTALILIASFAASVTSLSADVPVPKPTFTSEQLYRPIHTFYPVDSEAGTANLALNKPMTASSIEAAWAAASNASDGNRSSRWASVMGASPQWIYVDLQASRSVGRVVLRWEAAYATAFSISVSEDAINWTNVYSTTAGDGGVDSIAFPPANTRYVRMDATQRGSTFGYSLWEFEVYPPTPESPNQAFNKPATASSQSGSLTPNLAFDGNPGTRWSSNSSDPQWIYVDLQAPRSVNRVVLNWENAYGRAYTIGLSMDGTTWTSVYSTTTGDGLIDDISIPATNARFVRMHGTQRGTTSGYSLREFEVYSPPLATQGIGGRVTTAAMHRGHLVVSATGAAIEGSAQLSTWRLSQGGAPNVVSPSRVGVFREEGIFKSHVLGFSGDNVYIRDQKLALYDLNLAGTPPGNPARTASRPYGNGMASSLSTFRAGKYLYVGGEGYGTASGWVDVYDVSNTANPVLLKSFDMPTIVGFRCGSVHVLGNLLVVSASAANQQISNGNGVATFDLGDPLNPLLLDVKRDSENATDSTYVSYMSGHRLYSGGQGGGLFIYDVLDPENIQLVAQVNKPEWITIAYPVVSEGFAHLADTLRGSYYKVRLDTTPPQIVAEVALPRRPVHGSVCSPETAIPIGNMVFIGIRNEFFGDQNANGLDDNAEDPSGFLMPHATDPDNRGPLVNAVRPLDGETKVATTSLIGVSFDELIDTPSVTGSTLIIRPVGGTTIAGVYSNQNGMVNFSPNAPLALNTTYEIVVPAGGIKDTSGNATAAERIYRFSTGSTVSTVGVNLVAHYPLDHTAGTVADEVIGGTSLDGTLINFPASPWITGAVGSRALTFDGGNDYVSIPSLNVGDKFSFSGWVRIPSGTNTLHTIAGNAGSGMDANGFKFFVYGSTHANTGRLQLETGNGAAGSGNAANTAIGMFPFNQWTHVAVTVDRMAGSARIWINGSDRTLDGTIATNFLTTAPLNLGRMTNGTYYLSGGLDDFRLYSRALLVADVEQLRNLSDKPLGHWRFNNAATDSSPNGLTATLSPGGAAYNAAATMEGSHSLDLNGAAGHATTPTVEVGSAFTVAAWVNIASGGSGVNTIVANAPTGWGHSGFKLYVTGSTHASPGMIVVEAGSGIWGNNANTATNAFPFNAWTHVAVGVDRTRGVARIYVNGWDATSDSSIDTVFNTVAPLNFGRMPNDADTVASDFLAGKLDDVRVYQSWLRDDDVGILAMGKLFGHWRFDNSNVDESGFNRTATLLNGAGYSTDHFKGSHSLNLDGIANGSNDHATVAAFDLGNEFSVSLWAKITTPSAGIRTLLANTGSGASANGFRFFVNTVGTADGKIILETGNGTAGDAASTAPGVFQFSQWNHIALVVNRTSGAASIYYNRQLLSTDSTIRTDFARNLLLYIGRMSSSGNNYHGTVDDVRIYSKLLTASDIAALGAGSPNVPPIVSQLASSSAAAPIVDIGGGTMRAQVTLTASASDPNLGNSLLYRFNFGDGTGDTAWSSSNTAVHGYNKPGRYLVTVSVSDGVNTVSRTMTQIVYNPPTSTPPAISSEMVYDTVRNKVWAVVPDGDLASPVGGRVVCFDPITLNVDFRVRVGQPTDFIPEPVALALHPTANELWVACKRSGEIWIINRDTGAIVGSFSVGRGYMPTGVAFSPNGWNAYVTCEGTNSVIRYVWGTRTEIPLGGTPRGLAASATGRVFITRFRSPDNQGEVWEFDGNLTFVRTFALAKDTTTVDGQGAARGLPNYLSQVVIAPDGNKAWLPMKKDNILRGRFRDGQDLTHDTTVRALIGQLDLVANTELSANRLDLDNLGLPVAACFSPHGDLVFAAMIANEQVAVIDAYSASANAFPSIFTGDGNPATALGYAPSGLCVSPDGTRLFVHNFLERKVRAFDISALTNGTGSIASLVGSVSLAEIEPMAFEPQVLRGKKLFYNSQDPRLANEGYISCVSCHLGGDHDGRVWDLTQFGEGLRNTIDLRGRGGMGHGPLHWTGNFDEVQDFEGQIRSLGGGSGLIANGTPNPPMGAANAGRSSDLDALAAFATSLNRIPPSPYRNADGTLTAAGQIGATHFADKGCTACHGGTNYTDSALNVFHNVGTIKLESGQRLGQPLTGFDTPTLRGVFAGPPYLHFGQAAGLGDVFNTANAPAGTAHARFRELDAAGQLYLVRYLLEIE